MATLFAAAATISVYRRGERFQRQLVRPLLAVRHYLHPSDQGFVRWICELHNEGRGPANIESFTVVAGEEIIEPEPLQSPEEYWRGVLTGLGILSLRSVANANTILPPRSLATTERVALFDAHMQGERSALNAAIGKLEVRAHYRSSLGEQFTLHHRLGHTGP